MSAVQPAVSIGAVKSLSDGDYAVITDALVTYSTYTDAYDPDSGETLYTGECFVQSKNRTAGLRVLYTDVPYSLDAGSDVTITGHLSTTDGRYTLPDLIFTVTASDQDIPAPLGMSLKSLSMDMAYGLRVRTWGSVTTPATADAEDDYYYCDDQRRFVQRQGHLDRPHVHNAFRRKAACGHRDLRQRRRNRSNYHKDFRSQ